MSAMSSEDCVYSALERVKGVLPSVPITASLTRDLGLESIDVVDLLFEIEQSSGVVIELSQIVGEMSGTTGRRYAELSIQDLVDKLNAHRQ